MPSLKANKLILFLLLCLSVHCFSQTNPANRPTRLDSLFAVWQDDAQADSSRVVAYTAYISKGFLYSNPDSAIVLAQALLTFGEQHQYTKANALAYKLMGISNHLKSDYPKALDYFLRSLKIYEEIGDKQGIAKSTNNIGLIYEKQGDYTKAMDYHQRSLKIKEEIGDKRGVAVSISNIGNIYHSQGDYAKALDYYQRSLKIRDEIGDKKGVANTINNIGIIYKKQGDLPKALDYFLRSSKIFQENGDKIRFAMAMTNIGVIYQEQGDYAKALDYYQRSLKIREESGIKESSANTIKMIANIYTIQGDYTKALDYHLRGLKISEEIGDKIGISNSLDNIGIIYCNQGDYPKALDCHMRSLKIFEEIGEKEGIAASINNIGNIYSDQDDYLKALDYYERSLKISEEIRDKIGTANTLSNIGNMYNDKEGNYPKALEYYQRSLKIREELGNKKGIAGDLNNIGTIYRDQGDNIKAMDYLQRALKISEEIGHKKTIATTITNIGLIYFNQGDYSKALEYCKMSSVTNQEIGALHQEKEACQCLYDTYKAMGKGNEALVYIERIQVIDDSLNAVKTNKTLQRMEFAKAMLADSLKQVAKDQKDQLIHKAEIRSKNNTRNIAIVAGLALLFLSWGLYSRGKKAVVEKNLTDEKIDRVLQFEQLRKLDILTEGQDKERKRISEDLHDKLGGKFNALHYTWSSIYPKEFKAGSAKDEQLKSLDNIIQSLSTELRQVVQETAHSLTNDFGLSESLEELKFLVQSSHKMEINVFLNGLTVLDKKIELELYKVILELVSNSLKYSQGTHINIQLSQVDHHIILLVEDDGIGFDESKVRSGMGLKNIKSRAERLGGVIDIDSKLGKGTTVILELDA